MNKYTVTYVTAKKTRKTHEIEAASHRDALVETWLNVKECELVDTVELKK